MNITKAHTWCATLPGATLDHKWQFEDSVHPVYSVGGRMFAMFSMKGGKLVDTLMFKADDARFLELTDREGIVPAPYLARAKWVRVEGVQRLSDAELKQLLGEAHRVVLAKSSKKMQAAILAGTSPAEAPIASPKVSKRSSSNATPKAASKRPKR
jgi:predicted DNA-binding protein (MmcQ/YjbR family)